MAKFFWVIGLITMVLSGGCSLWALGQIDGQYLTLDAILVIGGVPFAVGFLIFILAKKTLKNKDKATGKDP